MRQALAALLILAALSVTGCRSTGPATAVPAPSAAAPAATSARPASSDGPIKPYERVITSSATSQQGLFDVHRVGPRWYYEIPDSLLNKDMLLITQFVATPPEFSPFWNAGRNIAEQVVRWERRGDRILLRSVAYNAVAADSLPIFQSVQANNFAPILRAFDIEARSREGAGSVIEVTKLFEDDVPAISGLSNAMRNQFRVRRLDPSRTYIDTMRSFPMNVEVLHTLTFDAAEPPSDSHAATVSMQLNQSMVLLPDEPMRPRFADHRVGWFTVNQIDYGLDEPKAATRSMIRRWRLEPSDPEAYARGELVEPVKPIVFYIDPATPQEWREYIRLGIEDWQPTFETAGFRNAILARDVPQDDPDFSLADVRHSSVRYIASTTRNALGPSVSDPRSGEIISSDVIWYHNHLRSYRNGLILQTAAANPAARTMNLERDYLGEAVRAVIAHEVGHALGLPHNMIASSAYPVDSLRSPTFTEQFGVAPTIMDYARQNYIAQPEDGVTRFIRMIGPYDHYAINWGYRVIPEARTAEEEKPTLDNWVLSRADDPTFLFGQPRGNPSWDPRAQTEDLGDDAIRASTYGMMNLRRVVPNLVAWTSTPGQDYSDLQELYMQLLGYYNQYVGHVMTNIGGVYETRKTTDQYGPVFEPVRVEYQRRAMRFLDEHVFNPPTWLNEPAILSRLEPAGSLDRARALQARWLNTLLQDGRLSRMLDLETRYPADAYPVRSMMDDLRRSLWSELQGGRTIDAHRRSLQRAHVERLIHLAGSDDNAMTDVRPLARLQLQSLQREIRAHRARVSETLSRSHLDDIDARIDLALNPR
jgi:hypothetical protein